jgi:four helix bundle protein
MRETDGGFGRGIWHRGRMTDRAMLPFDEWAKRADHACTGDPLWSVQAYRLAVYSIDCLSFDRGANPQLGKAAASDQVTRAVGSIAANIAEGYSRSSVADRMRFYAYALGSTREAVTWYDTLRRELGELADQRQGTLIQIRRLLLTTLRNARPEGSPGTLRDSDTPAP